MARTLLFVGLGGTNSGKTTLAAALLRSFRNRGVRAQPVKPFGGSNAWTDARDVLHSLGLGRYFGHDSELLRRAAESELREEMIAPVHRLWAAAPHDHRQGADRLPTFVLDRFTLDEDPAGDVVVVNRGLAFPHGLEREVEAFLSRAPRIYEVRTLEELQGVEEEFYAAAVRQAVERARSSAQVLVCESFGGASHPWIELDALYRVIAVHPGYFEIFDGPSYAQAILARRVPEARLRTLLEQSAIPWEPSVKLMCFFEAKSVVSGLRALARVQVPILPATEVGARLEQILEPFVESLELRD